MENETRKARTMRPTEKKALKRFAHECAKGERDAATIRKTYTDRPDHLAIFERALAKEQRTSSTPPAVRLQGRIVRETEKAILLAVLDDENTTGLFGEIWFPKSNCFVAGEVAGITTLSVPAWLVAAKEEELR